MELLDLVKVGMPVRINVDLSKDRLSSKTLDSIKDCSTCLVKDFRLTDGKGIGVVVELSNGEKEWFFENEIQVIDNEGKEIKIKKEEENSILNFEFLENFNYEYKTSPKELINPIKFLSFEAMISKILFFRSESKSLLKNSKFRYWYDHFFLIVFL